MRRNKDEVEVEKVTALGAVVVPELGIDNPHPLVTDFYRSLRESAQARYYEPSDWAYARFVLHHANTLVSSGRPSAQMFAAVTSALSDLLVAEGHRRRVRLEIEREHAAGQVVDVASIFKDRFAQ
nr:hypothetical protein [Lentzea flava]